jgi:hypothetical protein
MEIFVILFFLLCKCQNCENNDFDMCIKEVGCVFINNECLKDVCLNETSPCPNECFNNLSSCHLDECKLFHDEVSCYENGYGCVFVENQCESLNGNVFFVNNSGECGNNENPCQNLSDILQNNTSFKEKIYIGNGSYSLLSNRYKFGLDGLYLCFCNYFSI